MRQKKRMTSKERWRGRQTKREIDRAREMEQESETNS